MLDAIPEQHPVREAREAVVERLVADLVIETRVLQCHRGLAGKHRRELHLGRTEGALTRRRDLDEADRAPGRDQRDHRHRPVPDRGEVADLRRIGGRIVDVDDRWALRLQDGHRRGVVVDRVRLVQGGAALGRLVAEGDHPVRRAVPVAERAVVRANRAGDVDRDPVADESRIECLREVAGHPDDALEICGGRLQTAADLPQEHDEEGVCEHEGDEGDRRLGVVGQPVVGGSDRPHDDAPGADHPAADQQPQHDPARDERRHDHGWEQRGDGHGGRDGGLKERGHRDESQGHRRDPRHRGLALCATQSTDAAGDPDPVHDRHAAERDGSRLAIADAGDRLDQADEERDDPDQPDEADQDRDAGRSVIRWRGHGARRTGPRRDGHERQAASRGRDP